MQSPVSLEYGDARDRGPRTIRYTNRSPDTLTLHLVQLDQNLSGVAAARC